MGKIGCVCGAIIHDTQVPNPDSGWLRRDNAVDLVDIPNSDRLAEFVAAAIAGNRKEWIGRYLGPSYPADETDDAVIFDFLLMSRVGHELGVYQCSNCG